MKSEDVQASGLKVSFVVLRRGMSVHKVARVPNECKWVEFDTENESSKKETAVFVQLPSQLLLV